MSNRIQSHFLEALEVLQQFANDPLQMSQIQKAGDMMVQSLRNEGKIISCGNGGSMCDAMHFAEELTGRYRDDRPSIGALSISDPSHMSCVGNDYGYEYGFQRFVEGVGRSGDVLLAISTSGNSGNVIRAVEAAKQKGMRVVALTGKDGGKLGPLADVEIRAPKSSYADRAQEIHIKVIHSLIDHIEQNLHDG
ncbi:MAG: D-sedoheptulose 7-phosphate isomerase [Bacteroidota bacterium]|nr:D-sedoheptulose 7-phosphate isomerase [Bacteroidota bacterium]MDX5427488.1 D-sedoheptulose 7-phosphate isomerase [Bacteroidota bacterium]MDX5505423.1 D-sedoheptulose 7-phosphate isomerase [Bacteroidota bacterium]